MRKRAELLLSWVFGILAIYAGLKGELVIAMLALIICHQNVESYESEE